MHMTISILLLLCLTALAAVERPVSLAYDYEGDSMSAFRLYGARPGGDWQLLATNDGGTNRGFVVQVAPGQWVFRATAVDADGVESDPSNECRLGRRTGFRVRK
jgi:hypothetical protein